ncbi:hypothetical protein GGF32_005556 [Allomyces javanicus]|nr:hypothetical protein GGF32_005556 [Allomyces javanicus]
MGSSSKPAASPSNSSTNATGASATAGTATAAARRRPFRATLAGPDVNDPQLGDDEHPAVLDEQEQEDLIARYADENAHIDAAFKMAMFALTTPLAFIAAAQTYAFWDAPADHPPTIPIVTVVAAVHPYPTLASAFITACLFGLFVILAIDIFNAQSPASATVDPTIFYAIRQLRAKRTAWWLRITTLVTVANLIYFHVAQYDATEHWRVAPDAASDSLLWEYVFWGVPVLVSAGFAWAVHEMREVEASVESLKELKYKLKGA